MAKKSKIYGKGSLRKFTTTIRNEVNDATDDALDSMANKVKNTIKDKTPVVTGKLKASYSLKFVRGKHVVKISSDVHYAKSVNDNIRSRGHLYMDTTRAQTEILVNTRLMNMIRSRLR